MKNNKHFSKPGWWQVLCGYDAASVGASSGWTNNTTHVGCKDCKKRIKKKEHIARKKDDHLHPEMLAYHAKHPF